MTSVSVVDYIFAEVRTPGAMEELDSYLKLGEDCLEAVQRMPLRKFNHEQCGYLVDKLQVVVSRARLFFEVLQAKISHRSNRLFVDIAKQVEIFKLQLALAKQIETFVQGCCKDSWIQSATTLTNVWEYVASLGFNLELCKIAFCTENAATGGLTLDEVVDIHKAEVELVKEKASADEDTLIKKVEDVLPSLSGDNDKALASFLIRRHKQDRPVLVEVTESDNSVSFFGGVGFFKNVVKWLGPKWLQFGTDLGTGASGSVVRTTWLGIPVAMKTFHGTNQFEDFRKEVEILSPLRHPNVMSLFSCAQDLRKCSIVMELMDGDLHKVIVNKDMNPPFPILEAVDLMLQIGEGVNYLHNQKIVHRDLKGMNILVKRIGGDDSKDGSMHVRVADFGLSKTRQNSTSFSNTYNIGTTGWMAPEIIKLRGDEQMSVEPKYPFKYDTYSFAMVCFEILTGYVPYSNVRPQEDKKKLIKEGNRPELPEDPKDCPLILKDLIERCWSQNPKMRPKFDVICSELRYLKYLLMKSGIAQEAPEPRLYCWRNISNSEDQYRQMNDPRILVALDFGTTFTGFAFARKCNRNEVMVAYEWPGSPRPASGKRYCKTKTALYYKPSGDGLQLYSWGWQAQLDYTRDLDLVQQNKADMATVGEFVTNFKLHMFVPENPGLPPLPPGLTAEQVITDFLREIGNFIIKHLKLKYGSHLTMKGLQWCVTVPSTRSGNAKEQMRSFMEGAGLLGGTNGSIHPVVMVQESEAAAVFCLKKMGRIELKKRDRFIVADIGGKKSDITVQAVVVPENLSSSKKLKAKELVITFGDFCGSSCIDQEFMKFLSAKIGCFEKFLVEHPEEKIRLQIWWENQKNNFEGCRTNFVLWCPLPEKLAIAWKKHDTNHQHSGDYSRVEITDDDMVKIFARVVEDNIALITNQLHCRELISFPCVDSSRGKWHSQGNHTGKPYETPVLPVRTSVISDVKFIMVIGGCAGSKYLIHKIKKAFEPGIMVVSPDEPGRAICDGAVTLALPDEIKLYRLARKTYGICNMLMFEPEFETEDYREVVNGSEVCKYRFDVLVRKGMELGPDCSVSRMIVLTYPIQRTPLTISLYSCDDDRNVPRYIHEKNVRSEGTFKVDISKMSVNLDKEQQISVTVTMCFGRSVIELKALGVTFGENRVQEMLPVTWTWF
ncbi:hypothetical protein M758_7G096800 [Ceratodon purpureus]|nr:hypothetical protein M758_7G096800 [Ceratodon purpureus]